MTELNKFLIGIHKARWKSLSKKKIHFLFKMRAEYTNMVLGGECLSTCFAYFYILHLLFKDCQEFRNKRIIHKVINRGGVRTFSCKTEYSAVCHWDYSGGCKFFWWYSSKLAQIQANSSSVPRTTSRNPVVSVYLTEYLPPIWGKS